MNPTFRCFLAQLLYPSLQAHMLSTRVATHYRLEELHIWQFNDVMFFFGYLKYVWKWEIEGLYISITLRTCLSVLRRLFLLYNSCNYNQYMWGEVRNFAYILLCCNLILRNLSLLNCENINDWCFLKNVARLNCVLKISLLQASQWLYVVSGAVSVEWL